MNTENRNKIETFVSDWESLSREYHEEHYPNVPFEPMEIRWGSKYAKVVRVNQWGGSVCGFIDMKTGDLYKPASWAAPAKHARGNTFVHTPRQVLTPDGHVPYLRG